MISGPWFLVLADQADKRLDLLLSDVGLQQFPVVVQQGCDGLLCQHIIADLFLHEGKVFGDVFLKM